MSADWLDILISVPLIGIHTPVIDPSDARPMQADAPLQTSEVISASVVHQQCTTLSFALPRACSTTVVIRAPHHPLQLL
jgi:hypothetical protein